MKLLLLVSLFFAGTLMADFKVGDGLPGITLPDQFDKNYNIRADDTTLIMAFEKDVSVGVNEYLKIKPGNFLPQHHAKYISDISSMPGIITSMFALPKMKKYPFSMLLIYDDFGKKFNRQEGKITVFKLKYGVVQSIRYITDKDLPALFDEI